MIASTGTFRSIPYAWPTQRTPALPRAVVAYVRPEIAARLRTRIPKTVRVWFARSWTQMLSLVREHSAHAVFLDPGMSELADPGIMAGLIATIPALPIIAYTIMTPAAFGTVHTLTQHGRLHDVLLFGYDDGPERIAHVFDEIPPAPLNPAIGPIEQAPFKNR